ncbi:hypothetical protein QE395_000941 [Stenotrophomonas sp. SORGH_AS 282]|nr:hypothetical protein [Stenotrophomonas sp. SORGH_AS_0282]
MFWLCFATGCRFGSLVWQARSAGRNLITLFFTVNNPREKISHGCPPAHLAWTLRKRSATPLRRSLFACTHPSERRCVERKTLKRSTFANCTADAPALQPATGDCADGIATASRTGTKQGQKLFTSANAFCVRFCRTAQTFGRWWTSGSCRLRASMTRAMGVDARRCDHRRRRHPSRTDNAMDVGNRTMARAGKKKTAAQGGRLSRQARISCPLPRAVRRSRPGPAGR